MDEWMGGMEEETKNLFSFELNAPMRLVLDREDDMLITGKALTLFGKYKVSIKRGKY